MMRNEEQQQRQKQQRRMIAVRPIPTEVALSPRMTIEETVLAWLDAKSRRSESLKTQRAYTDTIQEWQAVLAFSGLQLDSLSDLLPVLAQGFAGRSRVDGTSSVSSATYNQRLSILSSFYQYAQKHQVLEKNPIDLVERRSVAHPLAALPLPPELVVQRLQAIDRTSERGLRDYALLLVLLMTGRRVNELAALRYGHLTFQSESSIHVLWPRTKGGKVMQDVLPARTATAVSRYLQQRKDTGTLSEASPVWLVTRRSRFAQHGDALGTQAIADICKKRLGTAKVHATRHTFAVTMDAAGASLSDIGARLGHSNLKTTSDYMKRLHSADNLYGAKVEQLYGLLADE
jgi:site-specific recombinase XerD